MFNPSRLSLARRRRKLTKKGLAEALGCDQKTVIRYESGEITPPPDSLRVLAKKLDFPEEIAVFFPVDISEYSIFHKQREVLFPPFYPIKIVDFKEEEPGPQEHVGKVRFFLETPSSVCVLGKNMKDKAGSGEDSGDDEGNKAYLNALFSLIKDQAIDKLCISMFLFALPYGNVGITWE